MELLKLFRRYQEFTLLIVVGALSLAALGFGIVPLAKRTVALSRQLSSLTGDISLLRSKQAVLQAADEAVLRNNLLTLASAVPPDKSLSTVMTTLDYVSTNARVDVIDVTLSRPGSIATDSAKKLSADEAKIGSNLLPLSVTVRGPFDKVRSFLTTISIVRRLFRVRSLDVSVNGTFAEARMELDGFYAPYPVSIGSVIQPISPLTDRETQIIAVIDQMPFASREQEVVEATASVSIRKSDPFSP